jgi:tetratricopeptide (TPR) repeat protein
MPTQPAHSSTKSLRVRRLAAFSLVALAVAGGIFAIARPNVAALKQQARAAYARGDYEAAAELAGNALRRAPRDTEAALLAGDAHSALKQYQRALEFYQGEYRDDTARAIEMRMKSGRILMHHLGRAADAEVCFRGVLQDDPGHVAALYELSTLLGVLARKDEAVPYILKLLESGKVEVDLLTLLNSENGRIQRTALFTGFQRTTPHDPSVLLAQAWQARNSHVQPNLEKAGRILADAVRRHPRFLPLRYALAELLWDQQRIPELLPELRACFDRGKAPPRWMRARRRIHPGPPRLWIIRGQLAERRGDRPGAARCYWEAFQRDPTSRSAVHHLAEMASQLGFRDDAERLKRRLDDLLELRQTADVLLNSEHASLEPLRKMVSALRRVGRLWEAWGWCRVAAGIDPSADWPKTASRQLRSKLAECPPSFPSSSLGTSCGGVPALRADFSRHPLPDWGELPRTPSKPTGALPHITFRDDAEAAGIRFQYFNSPNERKSGQRMFEFSGGGCAALDFDRDGWPDLYFTQGCRWPVREDDFTRLDRLYRNLGTGSFADVTHAAGLRENRFSGGPAAGDFDNDGFPDLYVANTGANRLYRNNGDGTFDDVTEIAGVGDERWSTSCLIADLNGDGLPDIYSTNYVQGRDVFTRICRHDDGRPRMCMPFHFPGAQDQLYLNLGDGRFRNVTPGSGVEVEDGKGLGVVAADLCGRGTLDLFVANDTVVNSLFENRTKRPGGQPAFVESGLSRGVALNRDGRAEGCMGIAVGDVDGDGRQDLFVSNFHLESNTLYLQQSPGTFADRTRESGLAQSSLPMLGFGTQFLDADLDGWLDLIVTNGHIDDLRPYRRPYRMPTQFYVNRGQGRFAELPAETLGPFFQQKALGRGLARLDWNRDGREDAAISFLDRPAALLTNTTRDVGNRLSLTFSGVSSPRDATGVTVRVELGKRTIVRQLTGGGGYQAANQQHVVIGLGPASKVARLEVRWPSGRRQVFDNPPINRELLLVENEPKPFPLAAP